MNLTPLCELPFNLTPLCELPLNLTLSGNSDDPGDVLFKILQRVLEQDENRETIRAECNAMLKKGFYFQIEKIRDEDSIDKKFNYTFVCTNKSGFQIDAF